MANNFYKLLLLLVIHLKLINLINNKNALKKRLPFEKGTENTVYCLQQSFITKIRFN